MDDQNIIALYWARSETAISETAQKYGGYCFSIAKNILTNHEDAEESVNDTYLTAWNAMPPRRPAALPFSQPFSARSPAVSPSTAGATGTPASGAAER